MWLLWSSVQWESRGTFIRTRVESPARTVQTSTVLVLSAVYLLQLLGIKLHKQTLHTKDDARQEGPAQKNPVSCIRANCKVEFSFKKNTLQGVFQKFQFSDLKICLWMNGRPTGTKRVVRVSVCSSEATLPLSLHFAAQYRHHGFIIKSDTTNH